MKKCIFIFLLIKVWVCFSITISSSPVTGKWNSASSWVDKKQKNTDYTQHFNCKVTELIIQNTTYGPQTFIKA